MKEGRKNIRNINHKENKLAHREKNFDTDNSEKLTQNLKASVFFKIDIFNKGSLM